jgi:hypothetical protein
MLGFASIFPGIFEAVVSVVGENPLRDFCMAATSTWCIRANSPAENQNFFRSGLVIANADIVTQSAEGPAQAPLQHN